MLFLNFNLSQWNKTSEINNKKTVQFAVAAQQNCILKFWRVGGLSCVQVFYTNFYSNNYGTKNQLSGDKSTRLVKLAQ